MFSTETDLLEDDEEEERAHKHNKKLVRKVNDDEASSSGKRWTGESLLESCISGTMTGHRLDGQCTMCRSPHVKQERL